MKEVKNIVLGVTGAITCWRTCPLCMALKEKWVNVDVIMTEIAQHFLGSLSLAAITENPVVCDQFALPQHRDVRHISLAHKADVFVVAPCTADMIGKLNHGVADDMLSTTLMATKAPIVLCPSMDENSWKNAFVQNNVLELQQKGVHFAWPKADGSMAEQEDILRVIFEQAAEA